MQVKVLIRKVRNKAAGTIGEKTSLFDPPSVSNRLQLFCY